ncbi:MAG: phosphoribosylglycinamide formyltransferase, partial [Planctomycetota bacterium]
MTPNRRRLAVVVFLSGGGRTLRNLLDHRDEHQLPIDIRLVISNRSDVGGLQIAADDGIPTQIISDRDFRDPPSYRDAMFAPCREAGASHVIMAGFLRHVLIPDDFQNRVINIHPSLLPAFGGPGMYGRHVHEAVIAKGVQFSGCTVHYVDNVYDNGPIIHQRSCKVLPDDTAETLAARVFHEECLAMPEAIR